MALASALSQACPSNRIIINSTNAAAILPCLQLNYECPDAQGLFSEVSLNGSEWNATTGPPPADCTYIDWTIEADPYYIGPFALPGVTNLSSLYIEGSDEESTYDVGHNMTDYGLSNVTSVSMPDLISTDELYIESADKIQNVSFPKLDLTSGSPPAINLSFPELTRVGDAPGGGLGIFLSGNIDNVDLLALSYAQEINIDSTGKPMSLSFPNLTRVGNGSGPGGIFLCGNIDGINLPALNYTRQINITSTGNLDCPVFVNAVLNFTPTLDASQYTTNNTVICNSKKGNVTTYRSVAKKSGGSNLNVRCTGLLLFGIATFVLAAL